MSPKVCGLFVLMYITIVFSLFSLTKYGKQTSARKLRLLLWNLITFKWNNMDIMRVRKRDKGIFTKRSIIFSQSDWTLCTNRIINHWKILEKKKKVWLHAENFLVFCRLKKVRWIDNMRPWIHTAIQRVAKHGSNFATIAV